MLPYKMPDIQAPEELDSFDTAFLVLIGTLTLIDGEEALESALKVSKDVVLWGPEAFLLNSVLYKGWKDAGGDDFTDALRSAFDLKDDIGVDLEALDDAYEKYYATGRKAWKIVKKKVAEVLEKTSDSSESYFLKQYKKAQKDAALDNWKKFVESASYEHIEKFIDTYPDRVLHSQIGTLAKQAALNPNMRTIDKADLVRRIKEIEKLPKEYIKNVSDIHAGRVWNFTGLTMARQRNVTEFQIIANLDKKTCPVCKRLHGTRFNVEAVIEKMIPLLTEEGNEDAIAKAFPFPRLPDVDNVSSAEKRGLQTMPPFHGRCRCDTAMLWTKTDTELPELPKKPPTIPETFVSKRNRLERSIYNRKTEKCYCFDKKGNVTVVKEGHERGILFTSDELNAMPEGSVFTHNHPASTSFSPEDLFLTIRNRFKEMRAVSKKYVYSFKPDWKYWTETIGYTETQDIADSFLTAFQKADGAVRKKIQSLLNSGKIALETANATHAHEVMLEMSKMTKGQGFKYSRRKPPWS